MLPMAIRLVTDGLALVGLLIATMATIAGNLLADLAYAWVDPRVSIAGSA